MKYTCTQSKETQLAQTFFSLFISPAPFLYTVSSYLWDLSAILCVSRSSLQQGSIAKSVLLLGESEKEGVWACVLGAKGREGKSPLAKYPEFRFLLQLLSSSLLCYSVSVQFFITVISIGPLFHVVFSWKLKRPCDKFWVKTIQYGVQDALH